MYPIIHITLPSYAVLAALGGLAVGVFLYFRINKYKLPFWDFVKIFALCIAFGFFGSRIVFFISRIPWLLANFSLQHLLSTIIGGGLVFYGGLLGVLLGIYVYCKRYDINSGDIYNLVAPAIPLFHVFGRVGCFMSGCCYGVDLKSPWVLLGIIQFHRIPTQLIEALFEFLLFIIIYIMQKKNFCVNSLKIYMISYAIFRFIIEFFRGDHVRGFFFGFSTSQIIAIGVLLFYAVLGLVERKRKCSKENV